MSLPADQYPFVSVGGLGGSGTRVVAQILDKMGYYLGPVLNPQMDSLLFTLLFKRADWISRFPDQTELDQITALFEHAMRDGVQPAFSDLPKHEIAHFFENTKQYGLTRVWYDQILTSPPPTPSRYSGLAWKEPNTHVFLPELFRRFPDMKYIHVLRHGLDMALSGNKQQLVNWGSRFGIPAGADTASPNVQLQYWLSANRRVIELAKTLPAGHIHLLNYDDLCRDFCAEIPKIETFLGRDLGQDAKDFFKDHIGSSSIGRFRDAPKGTFSDQERDAVRQFGFCVT